MNCYGLDYSLLDLGFSDDPAFIDSFARDRRQMEEEENLLKLSNSILKDIKRHQSPPKHLHDGTSPLPLGMDWSPPPRNWNGANTIWPHGICTGWTYCVTIPSWNILSESGGSEPIVFYRVEIGLQSPEGVTTMRGVLKRFSDFLKLSADLKRSFRKKKMPLPPPKGILRMKSRAQFEERRCSLKNWIAEVLSDIDFSRSAPIACFLELEEAARFAFRESSHQVLDINLNSNSGSSSDLLSGPSEASVAASEKTEIISAKQVNANNSDFGVENKIFNDNLSSLTEETAEETFCENNSDKIKKLSGSEVSPMVHLDGSISSKYPEGVEASKTLDTFSSSDLQFLHGTVVLLPIDQQQKMKKLLNNMQHRLVTSKTDMENLIARLNQELAARQYLTTKVKDLETELEFLKKSGKENMEQAILIERERYTQMQWDMEELRRKCMETEHKLQSEQDEKARAEATKTSFIQESESLQKELDSTREQLKDLQKCREDLELKSKSDVKLLAKEVNSLRNSQSELKQELDRLSKEKTEYEKQKGLQKEKLKREFVTSANAKLLHECNILRKKLEESNVNFLVEEEHELKIPSVALDILATSENRLDLLLAEAQLLAQGAAIPHDDFIETDDELRKTLTHILVDNATLRKMINSIMRYALNTTDSSPDKP